MVQVSIMTHILEMVIKQECLRRHELFQTQAK